MFKKVLLVPALMIGILPLVVSVMNLAGHISNRPANRLRPGLPIGPGNLFGSAMILFLGFVPGLVIVLVTIREWRRAGRTLHGLTDRWTVFREVDHLECRIVEDVDSDMFGMAWVCERRDGPGSLYFSDWPMTPPEWSRRPVGVLEIDDVARVDTLVRSYQGPSGWADG